MSLKRCLQSIDPLSIKSSFEAYNEKTTSLDNTNQLEPEAIAQILGYRALNEIVVHITDLALLERDAEQAMDIGLGASIAIGFLIEIAEVTDLPPVDS